HYAFRGNYGEVRGQTLIYPLADENGVRVLTRAGGNDFRSHALERELVLELQQGAQPQGFGPLFGKLLELGTRRGKLRTQFLIFLLSVQKVAISSPSPHRDIRYPVQRPLERIDQGDSPDPNQTNVMVAG